MPKNALCSKADIAVKVIENIFFEKTLDETIEGLKQVSDILYMIQDKYGCDLKDCLEIIDLYAGAAACNMKCWDTKRVKNEAKETLENGTNFKITLDVCIEKFNEMDLEKLLGKIALESRKIYLEMGKELVKPIQEVELV